MTLREESGNGPATGPETGGQRQELSTQQQEPLGSPQEPAAQLQESPAHPREAVPPLPPPREAPSPLEVPPPREAPSPLEVPPPREAPSPLAAAAPPQESAAASRTAGGHVSQTEPEPGAAPASPGPPARPAGPAGSARPGRTPGRRRIRAVFLIGGSAVICLAVLGGAATVLLLHGRARAPASALPSVFRLRAGDCVNSGPAGISSPAVVPCGQPHDAEVYARFALAGPRWPGDAAIGTQARQGCTARLGGYLNPQLATTVLSESYVFPDQGAWNAGERTIICEIRSTAGKLTGSVRGLS